MESSDYDADALDEELAGMRGTEDVNEELFTQRTRSDRQTPSEFIEAPPPVRGSRLDALRKKRPTRNTKTDREREPSPKPERPPGSSIVSLKALTNAVGRTTQEKLEILDNRDKIMRMARGNTKQADLATAEAIVGTCPDMCPEKERYLREERRRLGVYEILSGTEDNPKCDHFRAVKEYSRSSADQDMPLSNELRPPPVLSMTMDYLMNNIMDRGEDGKWGEWYEFLWSRTRSLRKDITQQHLCDLTTVSVVEKNCRWHIFCGERLCEEDMADFDQQINDENLTKCLQTLKELYHDLEKRGVTCNNEEEFRAYTVLMNLNEGDILREVQQLRLEVRESPAVKFATNVYSALNRNNYSKFFKLVKKAPFLYACLLHRYFNQVRSCAIRTMMKAYRWPNQIPRYPIRDLIRLLAFEHAEEATLFCQHHGLHVQDHNVLMAEFIEPEAAMPHRRAKILIESKQGVSIGEVVNGAKLPENVIRQPHSSFDENGHFSATDIVLGEHSQQEATGRPRLDVQSTPEQATTSFSPERLNKEEQTPPRLPEETPPPKYEISNEIIKDIAKELFVEAIDEHVHAVSEAMMQVILKYKATADIIYTSLETSVVRQLVRETINDEVTQLKREEQEAIARRNAEISAMKMQITESVSDALLNITVMKECRTLAEEEFRSVHEQLHYESKERVSVELCSHFIDVAVQEECCQVAEGVFKTDVVDHLQDIRSAKEATELLVVRRYFALWKARFWVRQRLRSSIQTFPPVSSLMELPKQVSSIIPESKGSSAKGLHLGMNAYSTLHSSPYVLGQEAKLKYAITLYKYWKQQRHNEIWSPWKLAEVIHRKLLNQFNCMDGKFTGKPLYWKLLLSVPDVGPNSSLDDEYTMRTILCCDWLKSKLSQGDFPKEPEDTKTQLLSLYSTQIHSSSKQYKLCLMNICVRLIKGFPDDEEDSEETNSCDFLGTSSIVFYVGEAGPDHGNNYIVEVIARLQHILENLHKSTPIPLVVVLPENSSINEETLQLQTFVDEGMISNYKFIQLCDSEDERNNEDLYDGILWLAGTCPVPPEITSMSLKELVDSTLDRMYFRRVFKDLEVRHKSAAFGQSPEVLVSFYNHLIGYIADIISNDALQYISWPIPEFTQVGQNLPDASWNNPEQLALLSEVTLELQMPECEDYKENSDGPVDKVWKYVMQVVTDDESNTILFSKIECILNKIFGAASTIREHDIPWADIIMACIVHKLSQTNWKQHTMGNSSIELTAHFVQEELDEYKPLKIWTDAVKSSTKRRPPIAEKPYQSFKRKRDDISSVTKKPEKNPRMHVSDSSRNVSSTEVNQKLNNLLTIAKLDNTEYESYLEKTCNEDCDVSFDPVQTRSSITSIIPPIHSTKSGNKTISADIEDIESSLHFQKQEDALFEMKLKSYLCD